MFGNFNEEAQVILTNAKKEMIELKHPYIGTEHMVLSILKSNTLLAKRLLGYNITYDRFRNQILKVIGIGSKSSELFLYTPLLKKVLSNAVIDSKENNDGEVTVEHLFSSLLEEGEGIAIRIFLGMGVDLEKMYDDFSNKLIKKIHKKKTKKLLIDDLGVDLTEKARNNELDPVIGREEEVQRVLEILCRRTKNNPILIGLAGVGKTAIVEELSRMIVSNNVPDKLVGKRIISLDMASMVSGTKYRGEFEERMKKVLQEIEDNNEIILFIDEIHTLVGAGGAEGAIDASNILKPALARGKIRCIGATTYDEYKKFIEKDGALDRRFQKVIVEVPSKEKTYNILLKLKPIYEKFHGVNIDDKLLLKMIDLSEKYIYDRNQPDKTIDILDEACASVSLKSDSFTEEILNLKTQIELTNKNKEAFLLENKFEKAYQCRKELVILKDKLNKMELSKENKKNVNVTIEDIATVINLKTHIPVYEILQDNIKVINRINNALTDKIVGQDSAIEELINITKKIKLGYGADFKNYSLLFVGPSGVGKTALAKCYAEALVGEDNLIRLDMSEYSEPNSVNKIIGSPPGYVGYEDTTSVLETIRNKPNAIILLDEIEKAHERVINLFYQILDEGKIKDSKGNLVRFDNNIIIMTSNIGYENNAVGFNNTKSEKITSLLKEHFSLSFINRIDSTIIFNHLNKNNIGKIIKKHLQVLQNKYANVELKFSNKVISELIDSSDYHLFGARRVTKLINSKLENEIIDHLLKEETSIMIDTINEKKISI